MLEMAVIGLVLAAMFALKTASMLRWREDEVAKSASFSWAKPQAGQDEMPAWQREEQAAPVAVRVAAFGRRQAA